jgi:protein O-mannosyl-transferase
MSERLRIALLVAVSVLVYGNALPNGFTLDDNMYVSTSPIVTDFSIRGLFHATAYGNVFRPVTFATYALNWALAAARPFGFHLVNVLLHACVTLLLYLVLRKLLESIAQGETVAWVAALLFAVHPLHTEAVASIAGRSELLAMGFLLAAWLLHLADWSILALASFALALLSKESAVAFVPLAIAGDYARAKLKPLYRYVAIAGVAVAYLVLLWKVQGGRFGERSVNFLDNPLAHFPAALRIPNALRIAWKYVWLHVYPATLSSDYSYNAILLYSKWQRDAPAIIAAICVLVLWIWTWRTSRREWFLAGAIYLCAFAVTSNVLVPTGTIMAERLTYLPSAGFCLLVALIWVRWERRKRIVAWAALGIVVLALATRTVARNRDWYDNYSLFSADVHAVPGSAKAHSNLALQYFYRDDVQAASRELQIALRIYPELPDALGYKGLIESRKGNDLEARHWLEKALSMTVPSSPNYDFIAVNLAAVEMKMGENEDALKLLDQEIAMTPLSDRAWSNRAVIWYQRGQMTSAHSDAQRAVQLNPGNAQARNLLVLLKSPLPPASTSGEKQIVGP